MEIEDCTTSDEDRDMSFCVGRQEIKCNRNHMASFFRPLKTMLYGEFIESRREKINFTLNGISTMAMKATELYRRTRRLDTLDPPVLLQVGKNNLLVTGWDV